MTKHLPQNVLTEALTDPDLLRHLGEDLGVRLVSGGLNAAKEIHAALQRVDTSATTAFIGAYIAGLYDLSTGTLNGLRAQEAAAEEHAGLLRGKLTELIRAIGTERRTATELKPLLGDRDLSTIGRQLEQLTQQGLVDIGPSRDGREKRYQLTADGRRVLQRLARDPVPDKKLEAARSAPKTAGRGPSWAQLRETDPVEVPSFN